VVLAILGISPAIKRGKLFFYIGGIYAGFMEEILYRGVIFALSMAIWDNIWITLFITSLSFGIWHLKNYYWCGKQKIVIQFFYTSLLYGPLFFVARVITGDIYLAVLMHYLVDTWVTFFPNWIGNRLINNDDPIYKDDFVTKP
jgi:membrane protease YdiL (CAAX protease family)